MQRGPHPSTRPYLHFLESGMADMITKGYWVVLPYNLVKDIPNLCISPMGAVPQCERQPRTIVNYSFFGINQEAHQGAPPEAMQFGCALEWVLRKMATAYPAQGPLYPAQDRSLRRFLPCPSPCARCSHAGCGLPCGPRRTAPHGHSTGVAYGVDGKSPIFLHNHGNNSQFS